MADDLDSADKTELPTERRRREVRERGQVARSADLGVAASVLAASSVLYFFGGDLSIGMAHLLRQSLSAPAWVEIDLPRITSEMWGLASVAARAVLPGFALVV